MTTTTHTPAWAMTRLTAMRVEIAAIAPLAVDTCARVTAALEEGDYGQAFALTELLAMQMKRLRRLAGDAAGLAKALEGDDG